MDCLIQSRIQSELQFFYVLFKMIGSLSKPKGKKTQSVKKQQLKKLSSLKGQRVVSLRFTHYCLLFCNKRGYECLSLLFCLYSHTKTPVANGKALFRDEFEGNETIAPHHVPICPEFKLEFSGLFSGDQNQHSSS